MQINCPLCGAKSDQEEIDHSNRLSVQCEGPACGNFEISLQAIKRISGNELLKQQLSNFAKECVENEKKAEFVVRDNQLISQCIA